MRKVIAINLLILIGHLPYIALRWTDLPYAPSSFYLEDIIGFGAMLIGPLLLINTILLIIFHLWSADWKKKSIQINIILLLGLMLFSLYIAITITMDFRAVWADCVAFIIYYLAFRWHRLELERCTS